MQAVDGLQPSAYLIDVAKRNIEGEISLDETRKLIDSYYQSKTVRTPKDEDEEEADKVSANIAKILASKTFAFNTNGYVSLHRRIFEGVFKHQEKSANTIFPRKEWVLRRFRKLPEFKTCEEPWTGILSRRRTSHIKV